MKRLKKRMIGLGLVCIVCFVASGLLHFWYPGQEKVAQDVYYLTSYSESSEVLVVKIVQEEQEITLGNVSGETLIMYQEEEITADNDAILDLFEQVYLMPLYGKIENVSEDGLSEYGLDDPSVTVTIADVNSSGVIFYLGDQTPDQGYYYCSVSGSSDVYLMDTGTADLFLESFDRFYDLSILPSLEGEDLKGLTEIALYAQGEEVWRLTQRKASETTNLVYYDMTSPVALRLGREQVEDELLTPLASLTGEALVEAGPEDLSVYSLDDPAWTLELTVEGEEYRALFAESETDGSLYAMTEGSSIVVLVSDTAAEFLDDTYLDVIGDNIFDYNINDVSELRVTSGGETRVWSVDSSGSEISVTREGEAIESSDFLTLITELNDLLIGGACDSEAGDLVLSVEIELTDEDPQVYEFYELEDRKCAVAVNGTVLFWCYRTAADSIAEAAEKL